MNSGPTAFQRAPYALARRERRFREGRHAAAAAVLRDRRGPVGGDARHHVGAGEVGAQPLAGLQLHRLDQRAAVARLAAREPGERTFAGIECDASAADVGFDLALRNREMLAEERIDRAAARQSAGEPDGHGLPR